MDGFLVFKDGFFPDFFQSLHLWFPMILVDVFSFFLFIIITYLSRSSHPFSSIGSRLSSQKSYTIPLQNCLYTLFTQCTHPPHTHDYITYVIHNIYSSQEICEFFVNFFFSILLFYSFQIILVKTRCTTNLSFCQYHPLHYTMPFSVLIH